MPKGVCRAGKRGKNGLKQDWPSLGGMQKCAEYVRGGRRTARKGWVPNQSQSGFAGGAADEGVVVVRQRRGPRGSRHSLAEWKPCQDDDDDGTT